MRSHLILLVACLAASPLAAQTSGSQAGPSPSATPTMTPEQREVASRVGNACMADIRSLCAGVQRGGGRIAQCLRTNHDRLSQTCAQSLQQARAARGAQQ